MRWSRAMTAAAPAIAGTALGDTNATASTIVTPAATSRSTRAARGPTPTGSSGWRPSRGPTSRILTRAGIAGRPGHAGADAGPSFSWVTGSPPPVPRPAPPRHEPSSFHHPRDSHGRYPMAPLAEPAVLALGELEAADHLAPQLPEVDDRVDDQFGGRAVQVDAALVLPPLVGHEGRSLGVVVDRGDAVGVHGVDRRLRPHDGDAGGRQGDRGLGLERRPGHGVEPGAVRLAQHDGHLGHRRLAHRGDHLGAVADDALALDRGPDHEARHV